MRKFKLFVSHAWDYADDYEGVVNLLVSDPEFKFENLSAPEDQPLYTLLALPKSNRVLVKQLDDRIRRAECMLLIAGMYCSHRAWIQSEIEAALEFKIPIIGVAPRGQERIPAEVSGNVAEMVRWNTRSIVEAICKHAKPPGLTLASFAKGALSPPPGSLR